MAFYWPAHQFETHILKATVAGPGMMIEFYGLPKLLEDHKHWMFTTRATKVKLIFACHSVILYKSHPLFLERNKSRIRSQNDRQRSVLP